MLQARALGLVPDAGETLHNIAPDVLAPAPPQRQVLPTLPVPRLMLHGQSHERIFVKHFQLTGNTIFPTSLLATLVKAGEGQHLTVDEMDSWVDRITVFYRKHGYLLARAYLPEQDVTEGNIKIAILEGRYGNITVHNQSHVKTAVLDKFLAPIKIGDVVQGATLEQQLLLMSDVPGAQIHTNLQPGQAVGSTDFKVAADPVPYFEGQAGADNLGNRYTGATSAHAELDVLSPLSVGDHLAIYGMDSQGGGTHYGHAAYDLPVDGQGSRLGMAYGNLSYVLEREFAALGAHGTATTGSFYGVQPLLRSRDDNVNLQVDLDHRDLHDQISNPVAADIKQLNVAIITMNGNDVLPHDAQAVWALTWTQGHLNLDTATSLNDAKTYQTQGGYLKYNFNSNLLLPLLDNFSAFAGLNSQWANKNLDVSEKMSLGGAGAVRAYPVGEAMADSAVVGTLELRYQAGARAQLIAFYDNADARINHNPLAQDTGNARRLSDLGLGLGLILPGNIDMHTELGWITGPPATSAPTTRPTINWQINKSW